MVDCALSTAAGIAGRPAGKQDVGVVDVIAAGQGHDQVEVLLEQLGQDQMLDQCVRNEQPSISTGWWCPRAIRMRSRWLRGSIYWVLHLRDRVAAAKPLS